MVVGSTRVEQDLLESSRIYSSRVWTNSKQTICPKTTPPEERETNPAADILHPPIRDHKLFVRRGRPRQKNVKLNPRPCTA